MRTFYLQIFTLLALITGPKLAHGQLFVEKQTRHRFAQLHLGLDLQTSFGGQTTYLTPSGAPMGLDLPSVTRPRFLLGGTHFWGHADFYIAIPLAFPRVEEEGQEIFFTSGVETVFKYYPWRIKNNQVRPFVGLSLSPYYYEQDNERVDFGNGQQLSHVSVPLLGGLTFNRGNHLVELSLTWNYQNSQDYYISDSESRSIDTPPLFASLSYRWMIDTTVGAEESWESGATQAYIEQLASQGALDGIFLGAGLSSAWWTGNSSYNNINRPYFDAFGVSLLGDYTIGYYLHDPDINIAVNYRGYRANSSAYGAVQQLRRRSIGLEVTKYLFDYHGFDPFLGPIISYEQLDFEEAFRGQDFREASDTSIGYGLTFGWDIRPDRNQWFILRTNLRWFPFLDLDVSEGQKISFRNVEFNFIQFVLFPNRL
ncbi:MAG: opacity family porin [Bacteroidota bacterium]